MSPVMLRRRVQELATAIDGGVTARRPDVLALVQVAEAVRAVSPPPLRVAFLTGLRLELLVAARDELAPPGQVGCRPEPVRTAPGRRRLAAATAVFVFAGGGVGLVATSAQALPGDVLYPVKRAVERVDLALHSGNRDDGRILLDQASTRLAEVQGLLAKDVSPSTQGRLIGGSLADFTAAATHGASSLLASYTESGKEGDVEDVRTFAASAATTLEALAPALPVVAHQAYWEAASSVGSIDLEAVSVCPQCGGGLPPVVPDVDAADDIEETLELSPTSQTELPDRPRRRGGSGNTLPAASVPQPSALPPDVGTSTASTTPVVEGDATQPGASQPDEPDRPTLDVSDPATSEPSVEEVTPTQAVTDVPTDELDDVLDGVTEPTSPPIGVPPPSVPLPVTPP